MPNSRLLRFEAEQGVVSVPPAARIDAAALRVRHAFSSGRRASFTLAAVVVATGGALLAAPVAEAVASLVS